MPTKHVHRPLSKEDLSARATNGIRKLELILNLADQEGSRQLKSLAGEKAEVSQLLSRLQAAVTENRCDSEIFEEISYLYQNSRDAYCNMNSEKKSFGSPSTTEIDCYLSGKSNPESVKIARIIYSLIFPIKFALTIYYCENTDVA